MVDGYEHEDVGCIRITRLAIGPLDHVALMIGFSGHDMLRRKRKLSVHSVLENLKEED